ncbi:hypothetical protein DICSQDRAFT_179341 [Dichomitus squalens LYAD-421 SS1]|uniref:uncharacterized protein n=1 Tax=Dichomitus squalens (strain LYAD-421) TaxID=732165 RepID=UPI00044131DF|nr:uncharacterized protein DICSQDRAFT_179341 [Dichomitus squalens LYAD-421 SS1]EJF63366.1 hypothetical protein DICSQDRAFT_179341 [Dichomitus squalens LYAD-421 SS1]
MSQSRFSSLLRFRFIRNPKSGHVPQPPGQSRPHPRTDTVPLASLADKDKEELAKIVDDGTTALTQTLPALLRVLDDISQIHPYISVGLLAFRVAILLGTKWLDADRKVAVLFLAMQEMMDELAGLQYIKDVKGLEADKNRKGAREELERKIGATAKEIEQCWHACETYSQKRVTTRVIQSLEWDAQFKHYLSLFSERRSEFNGLLTRLIVSTVTQNARKLCVIEEKLDLLLARFSALASDEEQQLQKFISTGDFSQKLIEGDSEALKKVLERESSQGGVRRMPEYGGAARKDKPNIKDEEIATLRKELLMTPEDAMKKNLAEFSGKFDMQIEKLKDDMRALVRHENDRVIKAFKSGPQDAILDKDIHDLWTEIGWPGHVKTRHFVLALCDYYRQCLKDNKRGDDNKRNEDKLRNFMSSLSDDHKRHIADEDIWALKIIDNRSLQALAEAFDDDASGFITVVEVNNLTSARPLEWSMPHWLAYWAIGWQMAADDYKDAINIICADMIAIRRLVHPRNLENVDSYLNIVWQAVITLATSFSCPSYSGYILRRFNAHVKSQENSLQERLEKVHYSIGGENTLALVTGPGQIEKHIMPLLYLLLRRHFEIMKLCQTRIIHEDELSDAAQAITDVFEVFKSRYDDLQVLFKQRRVDPGQQFKVFANQLFYNWHTYNDFWALNNLRTLRFSGTSYGSKEGNPEFAKFLRYPSDAIPIQSDTTRRVLPNLNAQHR